MAKARGDVEPGFGPSRRLTRRPRGPVSKVFEREDKPHSFAGKDHNLSYSSPFSASDRHRVGSCSKDLSVFIALIISCFPTTIR